MSAAPADATAVARPLAGLRVAVDVQHLYRNDKPNDRGSVYTVEDATHATGQVRTTEAAAATIYAGALVTFLRGLGAAVLTNDPVRRVLVGDYWHRNIEAAAWHADLYLACHLNAGGGRYACIEYMGVQAGVCAMPAAFILSATTEETRQTGVRRTLFRGDRGPVCIEAFSGRAFIVEPFFGDGAGDSQRLLAPASLARIGQAIGRGILAWRSGRANTAA